jgi:putative salt-induced outer membrane protein YdiY
MTIIGATLVIMLSQADAIVATPSAADMSPTDRAVMAAEKSAAAAEKAAGAAQRIAESVNPTPAAAGPGATPAADAWKGTVGVGLTFITGNTQTLTATAQASADRKFGVWAVGLKASGAYGLANANPSIDPTGLANVISARRAGVGIRGDRSFTDTVSIFGQIGSEFDHVKNLESRTFGEVGTGLTVLNKSEPDLEKLYLRFDVAARIGYDTRYSYFPGLAAVDPYGILVLAPRAAATFRTAFSKSVRFLEQLEVIPYLLAPEAGRVLLNSTTKLNANLTESVSLAVALLLNYDSNIPKTALRPNPVALDAAFTVGLEAAF